MIPGAWLALPLILQAPPCTAPDMANKAPRTEQGFTGSAAYSALRLSGREVVRELEADLDGDGRSEVLVVTRSDAGMCVSAFWSKGAGLYDLLNRSETLPASQLGAFELLQLGERQGFYLDVFEDNPDEADHHLLVFSANAGGLNPVFTTRYTEIHPEEEAGRVAPELIDLGGLAPGLRMEAKPDGWPILRLRFGPKELSFKGPGELTTKVRVGIYERVFESDQGRYRLTSDRFIEYLRPLKSEPAGKNAGEGITIGWSKAVSVRALRWVPSCKLAGPLTLEFGAGSSLAIPSPGDSAVDEKVLGVGEYSLGGGRSGVQVFMFLRREVNTKLVSISGKGVRECLSRLTALEAVTGGAEPTSASSKPR